MRIGFLVVIFKNCFKIVFANFRAWFNRGVCIPAASVLNPDQQYIIKNNGGRGNCVGQGKLCCLKS
jgi:hypothetical protein